MFFRITRELNPGIANFRNLEEPQFLLGAIGSLSGKNAPKKFTIRTQLFESWIVLSTDYHTIQRITDQENKFFTLASRSRFIQWISLYRRQPLKLVLQFFAAAKGTKISGRHSIILQQFYQRNFT